MAVYTELDKTRTRRDRRGLRPREADRRDRHPARLGQHQLPASRPPAGSISLRIDEVKGELEVKRELDLLLFLRKHGFPCPQPIADRKGRLLPRERAASACRSTAGYDGHVVRPDAPDAAAARERRPRARRPAHHRQELQEGHREPLQLRARRATSTARSATGCPRYFRKIVRTLDDEVDVPAALPREQAAEGHHPRRPLPRQPARSRATRSSPSSTSRPRVAASSSSTSPPR